MSEKNRSTRVGIAILYLAGCVNAGVLTTPVSESLWVLNDEQTQAAISITPAGNASAVPQPTWGVEQWNGPSRLTHPYTQTLNSNGNWSLANASASVQYDKTTSPWLGGTFTLSQNGASLPCSPLTEYDLFLSPKSVEASMGSLAGAAANGMKASQPLSTLQGLSFNLGLQITYEQLGTNCTVNQAGYLLGFLFRNTVTSKTLFYQIYFRRAAIDNGSVVLAQPNNSFFDDGQGNIGIDDHITNVASSIEAPVLRGPRLGYSVNILPRLTAIIQSGGPGGRSYDTNLSRYNLTKTYFGQNIWGNSLTTATWDNFNIITSP